MNSILRPAIFLCIICSTLRLSAQTDTSTINGLPITRQHFAVKYNVGLIGVFLGAEGLATYAPYNWLHVQSSCRIYEAALSGITTGQPHRAGWDFYLDVRYNIPYRQTFNGLSIGPFYNYGGGTLAYKERIGSYYEKYFDRFDFKRHVVGGMTSFSACLGYNKRLLLELYFGAGVVVKSELSRRPLEHMFMPDHTDKAQATITGAVRGGFTIGYIFF